MGYDLRSEKGLKAGWLKGVVVRMVLGLAG